MTPFLASQYQQKQINKTNTEPHAHTHTFIYTHSHTHIYSLYTHTFIYTHTLSHTHTHTLLALLGRWPKKIGWSISISQSLLKPIENTLVTKKKKKKRPGSFFRDIGHLYYWGSVCFLLDTASSLRVIRDWKKLLSAASLNTAVVQSLSRVWLCHPMGCSVPGFPVLL